ncbi:NAD/NADP-dependent octopine/nopaline dehydrogenase family protein [Lacicoccus qingdaonensis]|uniref:Opine dehydrogenase n=1 Tax=Lacicoccus qingdaonensis TaxID=576118 RepID=A0A1G9IY17_9BACL|nr:NAD/NADP-dependent octopine/nopaline dehydrogenase family protein [Salinicoccus qingdaonensis]SDL29916.1 opine dehydrogenase [Salinicoccus qingdaonensis]
MTIGKVAIIGAGNGGITASADLTMRGYEVNLFEMHEYQQNLESIRKKGGIDLKDEKGETFIPFNNVTTDIEAAVQDADIIMLTVPSFAIESITKILAPHVNENQIIFINGAGTMGSLRFVNKAKEEGINTQFKICETNSLTYGTRAFADEARVELSLYVKKIFFSAYPSTETHTLLEKCSQLYDCLVPAKNIWHTTLENGNPEVHPGPALLNAGRIDYSDGEFYLYKEGITEHTVKVLKAIEKERMAIGKAFGYELENAIESRAGRGYFTDDGRDLQTLFNTSKVYSAIKGPVAVDSRYFTEDISYGLVLWSNLGKVAGVDTPNIDSVITLGSTMLERDFYETGVDLKSLGFENKTIEELIGLV